MAGGAGSRLWPLSRAQYPKQFLPLAPGGHTLLKATAQRLQALAISEPLLFCNEEHRFLTAEQLRAMGHEGCQIFLEPAGRNTAPAIALAALHAIKQMATGDDPVLLVLAADHLMQDEPAFHRSVLAALPLAQAGKLVTCDVVPTHAETGYGDIEQGAALGGGFEVKSTVPVGLRVENNFALFELSI